ncbi:alpha/beta hydrolase fold domain-containing protein [Rhodococcus sp. MEB064]|uniref:alpha/beta hydrolase fold domain-containing protein n=1 Tax=Rhodococcus sp. MEB064 TaxID=1587522 RepID=UPI0018CFCE88|nr:alpha/beta hydrolase fold domain-containing protein [Rhodococcus sp. MEB064]
MTDRASVVMRTAGSLAGMRARRREGRPVDLDAERRSIDRITGLLRAPRGVNVTSEHRGGVPVVRLSSGAAQSGVVLYLHGGAYVLGDARQGLTVGFLAARGGLDVVSVDYRLAPEHPCPAAVDDALSVYEDLVVSVGARNVIVVGESAGGGLALLMLQRARNRGVVMPAGLAVAFPWADLTMSGASIVGNSGRDMLTRSELVREAAWFAGERDLHDPAVSPIHGSFRTFPPTMISVGTRDLLLDDSRAVTRAMRSDGVDVDLVEYPGAIHGFTALPSPEQRRHRRHLLAFVSTHLPAPSDSTGAAMAVADTPPGRRRYAALGHVVRVITHLPGPIRERLLDSMTGSITGDLPPVPDLVRLLDAAGGMPNGKRWKNRLLASEPHLKTVRTRDLVADTGGRLRARLYLPPAGGPEATAAFVWVHGGAFLVGGLDQEEAHWPAIELAASGIPVLSVDYRMCLGGVSYPAPQDDVLTAWRWAVAHADEIGVDPTALHLGGGSAGACLVAGATLRLRDAGEPLPASLYLGYPVLQAHLPPPTPDMAEAMAAHDIIDDAWVEAMVRHWAGSTPIDSPYVSPGLADVRGLPPTYVMSCGLDSLRRASEPFAARLRENGVPVQHDVFAESEHAPLDRPGTPDGIRAVKRLREWLAGGYVVRDLTQFD